jgi:hypothetical protein
MFFKTCEKCKSATLLWVCSGFWLNLTGMFYVRLWCWLLLFLAILPLLGILWTFPKKYLENFKMLLLPQFLLDFNDTSQICSIYPSNTGFCFIWWSIHFGGFYGLFSKKQFLKHVKNVKVLLLPQFPFNLDVTWQICSIWCPDTGLCFLCWFDKFGSFNLTFINWKI